MCRHSVIYTRYYTIEKLVVKAVTLMFVEEVKKITYNVYFNRATQLPQ